MLSDDLYMTFIGYKLAQAIASHTAAASELCPVILGDRLLLLLLLWLGSAAAALWRVKLQQIFLLNGSKKSKDLCEARAKHEIVAHFDADK